LGDGVCLAHDGWVRGDWELFLDEEFWIGGRTRFVERSVDMKITRSNLV
jgi:hypothetical protein